MHPYSNFSLLRKTPSSCSLIGSPLSSPPHTRSSANLTSNWPPMGLGLSTAVTCRNHLGTPYSASSRTDTQCPFSRIHSYRVKCPFY
ncbi:hypothetical protein NPIL_553451 [Nephila pilipes]|uniref:Uncharacterized protein n=1 Tax=Nephila pilipes TaxID=299642 RepID=A0A8X6PFD8_NEPPI|nr:hypothetical protein NPIL_553451 [Nephila pilipes]